MKKRILSLLLIVALAFGSFVACDSSSDDESESFAEKISAMKDDEDDEDADDEKDAEDEEDDEKDDKKSSKDKGGRSKRSSKKKDKKNEKSDVIVAGSIDTSSKFAFDIKAALIGTDSYDDDQVIVLCIGEFTNNSDEIMDFSSIVDVEVRQDGFELDRASSVAFSKLNYAEIKPGESIPIILGYDMLTYGNVDIVCKDYTHYAKEVLFEESYSIEELVDNTNTLISEYDDYISDDYNDSIDEIL